MGNKHHNKIAVRTGAQGAPAPALRACEILGQLGRALDKTAAAVFHAPGPFSTGRGGHHGRAARVHREHGIEHIVAARIDHGFTRASNRQQLGREMRIGPGLAITRDGGQQRGQIIGVN